MKGRWWTILGFCGGILLISHPSHAVTRTLTWNAVTQNTDESPAVVTGYTVYRSSDNGVTFVKQIPSVGGTILTFTDTAVPTGSICYEVTATNSLGESARSNRVCFSVSSAVPKAPTALQVNGPVAPVVP